MAPQTVRLIPLAAMEHLLKKAGAERVSDDAKLALKELLEEHGLLVAKHAIELALHAQRKTIKSEDIRLASKK